MQQENKIYSINGPVVTIKGKTDLSMLEMVYVGNQKLVGEVISLDTDKTTIQVYEETAGLSPDEPVEGTGSQLCALLGPGILTNIFDGIERPLPALQAQSGAVIGKGLSVSALDTEKTWDVKLCVEAGDTISGGEVYAETQETPAIRHKIMLSPLLSGKITEVKPDGAYHVNDTVAVLEDKHGNRHNLTLCQRWPIRIPRPVKKRLPASRPLITGQRVIDTLFPVAKGGAAAIPGGFGTGKTMTQHQLAKWCDADIIVYVGCGERGNEMTQALQEFSELVDPRTGKSLMERTVLIANTSNMPVAAREASIYTGITLAEYYRDMGYHTAIMADSTSRWADEGFPAYLPSRLSEFYECAGYMDVLSHAEGSVTIIGAVSPQGSDFSEPVTQNTKRFTRCFWALDKALAYARHYPAINWTSSYSEYLGELEQWYHDEVGADFMRCREELSSILYEESSLMEIVKLIGADVLPDDQKLTIEIARVIRVGFLQQNAFHPDDTYVPPEKQLKMMRVILHLYHKCQQIVQLQVPIARLLETGLFDKLTKIKYDVPNNNLAMLDDYITEIDNVLGSYLRK